MQALTIPEIKIVDAPSMSHAAEALSRANKYLDAVKAEELKVTKPLNEALKQERLRFAPFKKKAEEVIADIRARMSAYMTSETARVRAEEAKIAARIGDGKGKIKMETAVKRFDAIDAPEDAVATDSGLVKFRTTYEVVIVDKTLIPLEYMEPDESRILKDLRAGKEVAGCALDEVQTPVNYR